MHLKTWEWAAIGAGVLMVGIAFALPTTHKKKAEKQAESGNPQEETKTPEEIKREVMREMGRKGGRRSGESRRKHPEPAPAS